MFCPNCGRDCADANFCPQCGEKTQKHVDAAFCPKCGINCGNAKFCPQCGKKLKKSVKDALPEEQKVWKIPLGAYKGYQSHIELGPDWLEIRNGNATRTMKIPCTTRIPYDQLVGVSYHRSRYLGLDAGFMAVRWRDNQHLPIPTKWRMAHDDLTSVWVLPDENLLFYHICCFLYTFVDPTSGEPPEYAYQKKGSTKPSPRDLQPYYDKHKPYRQDAIAALCEDVGIQPNEARCLIDVYFDRQQQKEYAADPQVALRDLNKILHTPEDEQREQLEAANLAFCPKCLSTSTTARKNQYMLGRIWVTKIECICMKCGHTWEPSKK